MDNNKSRVSRYLYLAIDIGLDLIAILIAIVLIVRYQNQTPAPSEDELLAGILGILALIAISSLIDRFRRLRRIEESVQQLGLSVQSTQSLIEEKVVNRVRAEEVLKTDIEPGDEIIESASQIMISGITLGNTTLTFANILEQRLVAGAHIRIIVAEPSEAVLEQIVLRSWGQTTTEYYKSRIEGTTTVVRIIGDTPNSSGTLEVGYLPFVPSFGMIMADPSEASSFAHVEIYHHNSSSSSPSLEISKAKDPFWFRFFEEQFELLWKQCKTKDVLVAGAGEFEVP